MDLSPFIENCRNMRHNKKRLVINEEVDNKKKNKYANDSDIYKDMNLLVKKLKKFVRNIKQLELSTQK